MKPATRRPKELSLLYKFFFPKNAANRLRRFCALREPILRALRINLDLSGTGYRIVLSENLQETPIPRTAFVDHHDPVIGPFFRPDPGKSHSYQIDSLLK